MDNCAFTPFRYRRRAGPAATDTLSPAEGAHAVVHLGGNAIVADDRARIAQADRLALDYEAPQRVTGVVDEARPCRVLRAMVAVVFGQGGKRRFERASHAAERRDLLSRDLVLERVKARGVRT